MKKYIIYIAVLFFFISSLYILNSMFVSSKTDLGVRDGTIMISKQAWHIAPHGIAVDSSNNLYLGVPNLIMVFNRQGNFLHSYKAKARLLLSISLSRIGKDERSYNHEKKYLYICPFDITATFSV